MIIFCIPDIDMKLMLTEYTSSWSKMCGTKCHTGQSVIPYLWYGPPRELRRGRL